MCEGTRYIIKLPMEHWRRSMNESFAKEKENNFYVEYSLTLVFQLEDNEIQALVVSCNKHSIR
jgi:hypothetical protein